MQHGNGVLLEHNDRIAGTHRLGNPGYWWSYHHVDNYNISKSSSNCRLAPVEVGFLVVAQAQDLGACHLIRGDGDGSLTYGGVLKAF